MELPKRFDKKERYFLDIFFQGRARMVNHHKEVSPYNAFKSEKAAELREGMWYNSKALNGTHDSTVGKGVNAPELHREYYDEYANLNDTENAALVQRFTENCNTTKIRRATPKAHVQDVVNTVRNMQMLMTTLSNRVGIEGTFVIVRNNTDFNMLLQWHFTSKLERYMPLAVRRCWDTGEAGGMLEAVAIAGCDTINLLRTAPQKAAFAKGEIRDSIHKMLVEITGNPNAVMIYVYKE
ncbi:hypothetical protein DFH08DRAFT_1025106, partial [Mycena albidolilacea]